MKTYIISDAQMVALDRLLDEIYEVAENTGNRNITEKIEEFDKEVLHKIKCFCDVEI